ncbi:MAG TPA: FHA domain-containing protein [Gemmatimonadales bacterium]|nr:FHA domain-containing protein [Gemmatimonadales bacterium]
MALLELGGRAGQRYSLPQGEVLLGADPSCAISLAFPGVLPLHAKIKTEGDGQAVISKAVPEAEVLINGVRLGGEPTPLLHGDKVEVAGQELTFVDERRSGSTQYMHAITPQAAAQVSESKGGKATANTGGRVVSLTDGREYAVAGSSLVFGRDASCDVVVSGKDVSRRHAEIVQTPKGYVLVDSSTNGTSVNEARVEGQRLLARADVITIGEEKFRFYADTPAPAPAPSPSPQKAEPAGKPAARLRETVHGMPAARPPGASAPPAVPAPRQSGSGGGGALAALIVRSGAQKGQRLVVRTPVVNIGRAEYNDLVLTDESVSTTHAKLQRREGVWVLIDLDSTNGTFVDGDQVKGETPLAPGANVRFGEIGLVFEPTDDAAAVAKGGATRMMEAMTMEPAPAPKPAPTPPPPKPAAPPPKPVAAKPAGAKPVAARPKGAKPPVAQQKAKGCGASAVILLVIVGLVYWVFI